ncbi:F-box domain-containing protein [Caenorhabditis elegans]|uniref:F-box domain-containing protein n=1 Tax=Caenorhabditis elegans TaxID=6239 RepID=A0A0M7RDQ3_CAEEL|nr:F-box domain-containing protein [Caenorhabditis elegans]CUR29987.1 F-box domain-containing protein [Caenorhabditis elegans]|eukprot:NP_001303792.1 Uncharacterized protein CELE_T27A1.3 [Caenorhabditis elegans]
MFKYLLVLLITIGLVIAVAITIIFKLLVKKPFQITKLPHLAFKNVINLMAINEAVNMAETSKNVRSRLKQVNRKIFKLIIECHEDFSGVENAPFCQRVIVLDTERNTRFVYQFMMNEARKQRIDWATHYDVNYYINFFCTNYKKENKLPCMPYKTSQELISYLSILNDSFSIDHVDLAIDRDRMFGEYRCALEHPLIRKCHFLKLLGDDSYITTEDMKFILNYLDLKHGLLIRCLQCPLFNSKLLFNIPRLDLYRNQYFTVDDLKNMKCEKIRLFNLTMMPKKLNKYIAYWLAGNLPKLRRFQLNSWFDGWTDDLLNGLPHSKWNPRRRAKVYW